MAPNSVANHYDTLLAEPYTWMFGARFDQKDSEQRAMLELFGASATPGDRPTLRSILAVAPVSDQWLERISAFIP
jgi:hypothetical protein